MRIFFFPSWYPTDKHPQNGNFILEHAKAVALHHEVFYFTFETKTNLKQPLLIEKHQHFTWVKGCYRNHPIAIVQWWRKYNALKCAICQLQPLDVLHVHVLTQWFIPLLYLSKKYRIPLLVTEHWTRYFHSPKFSKSWWELQLIRLFAPKKQLCTTVSKVLANAMKPFFPSWEFAVVPNVIDVETFSTYTHQPQETFTLLHISSLQDWQKGVYELVEVFLELKDTNPQIKLVFIGGTPDKKLQQLIKTCSDADAIQVLGVLSPEEVALWMSKSSVLVLNSRFETFCKVIYEAAVVGLPVIAPDLPAIREFFQTDMGVLFPVGNRSALKQALLTSIQQPIRTSSQKQKMLELFGKEVVANRFDHVYQNLIERSKSEK